MRIIDLTLAHHSGEQHFAFHPGLNILYEPEESQLRILWGSLLAMLYGTSTASAALPRSSPAQPDFRPWNVFPVPGHTSGRTALSDRAHRPENMGDPDHFNGALLLMLDSGREFRLHHRVTSEGSTFQIFDAATGEDLTAQFQNKIGQNFAERSLGLNRDMFLATACLHTDILQSMPNGDGDLIAATLSQAVDSATTQTSADTAIQRLDRKLAELGSEYSATTLLARARAQRDALQQKLRAYQDAQAAQRDDQAKTDELAADIKILQTRLAILQRQLLSDGIGMLRNRLARYDDCRRQLEKIAAEQIALAEFKDFPVSDKEKFFQLYHEFSHLHKLHELLIDERNTLEIKLMALAERTKTTGVAEELWHHHTFEEFYALRTRWQTTFEQILELETARHAADDALNEAGLDATERTALATLDLKRLEELKLREAEIKEQKEQVEMRRAAYDDFQRRAQSNRRYVALAALAALAVLTGGLFRLDSSTSTTIDWSGTLPLMLSIAGLLLFLFLNYRWLLKSRQLTNELFDAENLYMTSHQALREILSGFKVENLDELIRQRMLFMEIGSASQEYAKRTAEMEKIEQALMPWLQPLGLGHIAIETLANAETRLRESHQLWQEKINAQHQLQRVAAQTTDTEKNRERVVAAIELALSQAKIAFPRSMELILRGDQAYQTYVQACQKREYLETLQTQGQQIEALAREILAGQTRQQTVEELNRLEKSLQENPEPRLTGDLEETLSSTQLRERMAAVEKEIAEKEQTLAVIRERLRLRELGATSISEIDEALALAEDEVARWQLAQQALQTARNTILTVTHHLHRDFARRANVLLNRQIEHLTDGRYASVNLDPADFSIQLFTRHQTAPGVALEKVSTAIRQQIFLFLRAALPGLMSESRETIPLLFNDVLPSPQVTRSRSPLRLLEIIAEQQQVIYFTKDKKTAAYLQQQVEVGQELERV